MPWTVGDVEDHIKGLSDKQKEQWVAVANSALSKCQKEGGEDCDASAIRQANSVVQESRLAEVITEAARRRTDARVAKAIQSGEGLGEALEWLKTQEIVKEGEYPAAAYAYTPDLEQPSTWRLRLREGAEITKAQLAKASAALSPGGFKGQKADIPKDALPMVKSRIREAYRSLELEIPKWVKEAEMRQYVNESMEIPLSEVSAEKLAQGIVPVRILQPGPNKTKERVYTESAVKDCVSVFEGTKMYANHPTKTEERERPERDIRDWVATLRNVSISPQGNAIGEAHIHSGWLKEMVSNLFQSGALNQLGTSIRTIGRGVRQKIEGRDTLVIEGLVNHPFRSVDFVTEAGAGGAVGVTESTETLDVYLVDLQQLRESRPDLITQITSEAEEKAKSQLLKEARKMSEQDEKIKELETERDALAQERDTLKGQIEEAAKAQRVAEAQAAIQEAVSKATLPEPAKARLVERFAGHETVEGLEEAIKAEADYIAKVTEAGKPKGMGKVEPDKAKVHEDLKESFKRLGMSDEQAEIAAKGR